jgi:hypothetical protein
MFCGKCCFCYVVYGTTFCDIKLRGFIKIHIGYQNLDFFTTERSCPGNIAFEIGSTWVRLITSQKMSTDLLGNTQVRYCEHKGFHVLIASILSHSVTVRLHMTKEDQKISVEVQNIKP